MQENKVIVSVEDKGNEYGIVFTGTGTEIIKAIVALITKCFVSFAERHSKEELYKVFNAMCLLAKMCIEKELGEEDGE